LSLTRSGSFDDPSAGQDFEPLGAIGSLDDFELPFSDARKCAAQLVSSVAAIGEDMAQPWIQLADGGEHEGAAVAILNIGGMHDESNQITLCVGDYMALAPLIFLPAS
jgi:hypothetical protein